MTKPAYCIELNGKDVTERWGKVLESVSITDEAGIKADTCEIAFSNRARFSAPPLDAEIRIWFGYEPAPTYMGRYKVDSWTKGGLPDRLTISGQAADMTTAIKAPKIRSHHAMTVAQIVNKVAADHGLTAIVDATIGARTVPHIDQQHESDISFLSRLAKRNGATFKLGDGKILFAAKGSRMVPSGKSKVAKVITPADLSTWDVTCSRRGDYETASAHYMDHQTGKRRSAATGTPGQAHHRDRRLYGSQQEASAAAHANLGDLRRGVLTATLELVGDPTLFAEALVTLSGFDNDVDGNYLAKSITHTLSGRGYTTSATVETEGGS
jgi:phage protein D